MSERGSADPYSDAIPEYGSADAPKQGSEPDGDLVIEALAAVSGQLSELVRLRARDVDLADRLYAENTRLRNGEFATAVAPLLSSLLRLYDQMTSLAEGDSASVAGMLRIQLLQILDTAAGLSPFEPRLGDRFDASRHAGVGRVGTVDPAAEGTVARNIKPGFERVDGSVVRVAQVEVYRFESH
jgi:molecular chaperone GrpE (heat shock protein)